MRILFCFIILWVWVASQAQKLPGDSTRGNSLEGLSLRKQKVGENDSLNLGVFQPTIHDYLYWKEDQTKRSIDTALSLENQYKYTQFNHQDNFNKIAFNNIGQPFNSLVYTHDSYGTYLLPTGKSQMFISPKEIRYFDVKTPTTQFTYNNGMREGQALRTLFTHNINSQFNYALEYYGLRSLGKYLESEVDSRTFIASINYHSKNQRYQLWAHYYNLNNGAVENAGIQNRQNFTSGDPNYRNRQRLLTNLTGARSKYLNRRYYLGQSFDFLRKKEDSIASSSLQLKNILTYESIDFRYLEKAQNQYYTTIASYIAEATYEANSFQKILTDQATLAWELKKTLQIEGGIKYQNQSLSFQNPPNLPEGYDTPQAISDNRFGFIGNLNTQLGQLARLQLDAEWLAGGFFKSTYALNGRVEITPIESIGLWGRLSNQSRTPALNILFNTSFYDQFIYNYSSFNNENYTEILAGINLKKYKTFLSAKAISIENYTYLNYLAQPIQSSESTQIIQFNFHNQFDYKKFHLDTELSYQNTTSNQEIVPLPSFVGRLNVFYKSMMFKNAANVQIGLKAKFFSSFYSREYFPIVNEFKLQEESSKIKIGNYPVLDFYFNMRVKTMQIYLEAQHFNSFFTGYNYFSTPNIPLYDFRLNIGIVWNLFT